MMTITWYTIDKHKQDHKVEYCVFKDICEFMISYFAGPSSDAVEVTEYDIKEFKSYLCTYKHHFFDEAEFNIMMQFASTVINHFKWDSQRLYIIYTM